MTSQFVESLKRLYCQNKITIEKLQSMHTNKRINQQEYDHITQ